MQNKDSSQNIHNWRHQTAACGYFTKKRDLGINPAKKKEASETQANFVMSDIIHGKGYQTLVGEKKLLKNENYISGIFNTD